MSCDWSAKLDLYVDSELPAAELSEFEQHLKTCSDCASGALTRLQWKRTIQSAGQRYLPTPEFRLKIEKRVSGRNTSGGLRSWMPPFAMAATLALVLGSTAFWLHYTRAEQGVAELADLHVATLASANPVDVVSTDRHTVKPWFQGKLPFTFNLPELQNSPFKLMGGSLAYFHQSPGAHLLFAVRKHEISVFIFQNRAETSALNSESKLTFNSETWTEGSLRYFLIGDCNRSDLRALSELLKEAARQ